MRGGLADRIGDVNDETPLAHSALHGRAPQSYADHIDGAVSIARCRAEAVAAYLRDPNLAGRFVQAVLDGTTYHDLGKLDADNQAALRQGRSARMPWDHVDAGVAHLLRQNARSAAWIVRGHHDPGLVSLVGDFNRADGRQLRGGRTRDRDRAEGLIARTNATLAEMVAVHTEMAGSQKVRAGETEHGLFLRLALSCLVDGDHGDTARFERGSPDAPAPAPRWTQRLAQLDRHVASLPRGGQRQEDRDLFFRACRDGGVDHAIITCAGPVGIGKTLAVTAWLLRRAIASGARRLFVVAPYTTILTQTAQTLRAALVLPDEAGREHEVVAEHHHRADFDALPSRDLALLWRAPIVLTTGVQFFETLASCEPARLRKLNGLPGSVVFLDEAHAALAAPLWRQNWAWLCELAADWGCSFALASGSLARAWEHEDLVGPDRCRCLPEMIDPDLARRLSSAEHDRVRYRTLGRIADLGKVIADKPGPRLVIFNTVQTAAVMADRLRRFGMDVLHLSTALCPDDRAKVLEEVKRRLGQPGAGLDDWTLVATSLIEAGVDLSFRTAFRERFSTASLIQVGGRVNRHARDREGEVFDFQMVADELLKDNPDAARSDRVLRQLFEAGVFDGPIDAAEVATCALKREIEPEQGRSGLPMSDAEGARNYPEVARLGRLIDTESRIVIVKPELARRLEDGESVSTQQLLGGSVSIVNSRADHLGLRTSSRPGLYLWPYEYDPAFLGYMAGALELATGQAPFL